MRAGIVLTLDRDAGALQALNERSLLRPAVRFTHRRSPTAVGPRARWQLLRSPHPSSCEAAHRAARRCVLQIVSIRTCTLNSTEDIMVRTLALLAAAAACALVTSGSPADAAKCVRTGCSWTVVMGTCKTFAGRVPCPVRKKVCTGERYCTT